MRFHLNTDDVDNVVSALEQTHRILVDKATSWSFDLENDYDNYLELRQKELELASTIHTMKRQRTSQRGNPLTVETPLADWERELLNHDASS